MTDRKWDIRFMSRKKGGVSPKKRSKRKGSAVFFDRDGTLTRHWGIVLKKEDLKIQRGAHRTIRFINKLGLPVIVITNQGSVARGTITEKGLRALHEHIQKDLKKGGAFIDRFYFCPHHPTEGKLKKYSIACDCRKPNPGMLKDAAKRFNLDLEKCLFVGDTTTDIATGNNVGAKTVLVKTGHAGTDKKFKVRPDYSVKSIAHLIPVIKLWQKKARP